LYNINYVKKIIIYRCVICVTKFKNKFKNKNSNKF
jgi:hypothetical protein